MARLLSTRLPRRLPPLLVLLLVIFDRTHSARTRKRLDSDLTFDEAGAASPLSDESTRHKRQSFWDWNNGAGDAAADDYTYEDNGDYNGDYYDGGDYNDGGGGAGDGSVTASGDGPLVEPPVPTLPTDDEDLVDGSGEITPRIGPRPTRPVPTAPAGLVYYRLTLTIGEVCQPVEQAEWLRLAVEELFESTAGQQLATVIQASPGYTASSCDYTVDLTSRSFDDQAEFERRLTAARARRSIGGRPFVDFQVRRFGATPTAPSVAPERACTAFELTCRSGECLPQEARCNGRPECADASDELGCPITTPAPAPVVPVGPGTGGGDIGGSMCRGDNVASCNDGSSICEVQLCDGASDCPGGEDELGCPDSEVCQPDELLCDVSRCVTAAQRCNGVADCTDGLDERNCPTTNDTCIHLHQFTCAGSLRCIPFSARCDGRPDCPQGDDEMGCPDSCSALELRCGDGSCVDLRRKCDGINDCLDGADERDCRCGSDQWSCGGGVCVESSARCDGRKDCADMSDERDCPCRSSERRCGSAECLPEYLWCDGTANCRDGSDELNCECREDEFQCGNGYCITLKNKCDGIRNCQDGTDEQNCPASCTTSEFACTDGTCVSLERRCDRVIHCPDGSDETGCPPRCRPDQFACTDGRCLSVAQKCNGVEECPGGEDESGCAGCGPEEFRCSDGLCIPFLRACDGFPDCRDGSDEERNRCPDKDPMPTLCEADDFRCSDGSCVPGARRCDSAVDCPDGSDERGCMPSCREEEFQCVSSGQCVDRPRICDGFPDCSDNSDEANCTRPACQPGDVTCGDGACVPASARCDGVSDCVDGADEQACECPAGEFRCRGGACISESRRCDGITDCPLMDDEQRCPPPPCAAGQHRCGDGTCLDGGRRCNGVPECNDRSDEQSCPCTEAEFTCGDGSCIPKSRVCDQQYDCRDYTDEMNCIPECRAEEHRCGDGRCIPASRRCDGRADCSDFSDEDPSLCQCRSDQWQCRSLECIALDRRCDQRPDCRDGSDEQGCQCRADQWQCQSGQCVALADRCNRQYECRDGSDERNCPPPELVCGAGEFRCADGQRCLPQRLVCDRRPDCADSSDEANCGPRCGAQEFECADRSRCIPSSRVCNGYPECGDGSDERNCGAPPRPTPPGPFPGNIQLATYPEQQTTRERNEVVFQCRDEGPRRLPVTWSRGNGRPLPPRALQRQGRLTIPDVQVADGGTYQCSADGVSPITAGASVTVALQVEPSAMSWTPGVLERQKALQSLSQMAEGVLPISQRVREGKVSAYQPSSSGLISIRYNGGHFLVVHNHTRSADGRPDRPPATACSRLEATCRDGSCIPRTRVCDGERDCPDGSDESRCNTGGCQPNEYQCDNRKCVLKTWRCDGDDDCGDGSDEDKCTPTPPGAACNYNEFQCNGGDGLGAPGRSSAQCIPRAFHCDGQVDCQDRSDEVGCSVPVIVEPPPPMQPVDIGSTFVIRCRAVGTPVPEISWRLNWGHVPPKCSQDSADGQGTLTCPDAQVSDQGAYSCEAINIKGSVFAIPDTVVVVSGGGGICQPPEFNSAALTNADCQRCFCFGVTDDCFSSGLALSELPPPNAGDISLVTYRWPEPTASTGRTGGNVNVVLGNAAEVRSPPLPGGAAAFFALPASHTGRQLGSYGGYLRYNLQPVTEAGRREPSVVIIGNGLALKYTPDLAGNTNSTVQIREGVFYRTDSRGVDVPAAREDIMMVLANIDSFLIGVPRSRNGGFEGVLSSVRLETATAGPGSGRGSATLVEQCRCPLGYSGLSCEECAPGFERVVSGRYLGQCQERPRECSPGQYGDPRRGIACQPCECPRGPAQFGQTCRLGSDNGITCDCPAGYMGRQCERCAPGYQGNPLAGVPCQTDTQCDPAGSIAPTPDPQTGRCRCKTADGQEEEFVTGARCDQCKSRAFFLGTANQHGCINCFCMGVTDQCGSSSYYRQKETAVFTSSTQGFELTDELAETVYDGTFVNADAQEVVNRDLTRAGRGPLYWRLPARFLGDKCVSYGGQLAFKLRHTGGGGRQNYDAFSDVEIFGNDIRLKHKFASPPESGRAVPLSVTFQEQHWSYADAQRARTGALVDREHLMMALADLEYIIIKAAPDDSAQQSALSEVSMDVAVPQNTGLERADAVESCSCPRGYKGLSCQDCDVGYTRSDGGLYLGTCTQCDCNGRSDECDPDDGVCLNCRENTAGERCDVCAPGYSGDPMRGQRCRPDTSQPCDCDPRGTQPGYTECGADRQCQCKRAVEGASCDRCRPNYFSLNASNPEGCLRCYCSGVLPDAGQLQCSEATFYRTQIPMQVVDERHGFSLVDRFRDLGERTANSLSINTAENEIGYQQFSLSGSEDSGSLYWSLPDRLFLGDRLTSYGGKLMARLRYEVKPGASDYSDSDVIISGNGIQLSWVNPRGNPPPGRPSQFEVELSENAGWARLESGRPSAPASRQDVMRVLSNVDMILVRATYSNPMQSTFLSNVVLDTAIRADTQQGIARGIEQCRCPPEYTGLSCQDCAPHHYRVTTDPTGPCQKCPCNDNDESCFLGPDLSSRDGRVQCRCRPGFSGQFCQFRDGGGSGGTPPPPTISVTVSQPIVVAQVGSSVTLICNARSLTGERVSVRWYKQSGELPERANDDRAGLLVIRAVISSDSGVYVCEARDSISIVTEQTELRVGGGEPPAPRPPRVSVTPRYLQLTVGQPAQLQCAAEGSPTPTVQWAGGREGRMEPDISIVDGLLVIGAVRKAHEAQYTCTATSASGTDTVNTVIYVSGDEPPPPPSQPLGEISPPDQVAVRPGQPVRITCRARDPAASVAWSREQGRLPQRATTSRGELTIPNAEPADSGIYVCTITISSGQSEQQRVRVEVIGGPEPPRPRPPVGELPTARVEPDRQTVAQGTAIELRCQTQGSPQPEVVWSRAGEPLPPGATQRAGVLTIPAAAVSDRGLYVCRATNAAGTAQASAIVEVERSIAPAPVGYCLPAEFECLSGQCVPLEERCNGIVSCRDNSDELYCGGEEVVPDPQPAPEPAPQPAPEPAPQPAPEPAPQPVPVPAPECRRDEVTCRSGRQCIQRRFLCDGVIDCTDSSDEDSCGPVRPGREVPSVEIYPESSVTISRGGSALFQCRVNTGAPPPEVSWARVDRRPLPTTAESLEGGVIRFIRVTGEEEGEYVCTATNLAGTTTVTATLSIESPPVISLSQPTQYRVREGQQVSLECRATGDPLPAVSWQTPATSRDSVPLAGPPGAVRPTGEAVLRIGAATRQDSGVYTCRASNSAGQTEQRLQLLVESEPSRPGPEPSRPEPSRPEPSRPEPSSRPGPLQPSEDVYRVPLNGRAELTCYVVDAKRDILINWIRSDGREMPEPSLVRDGTLYINNVQKDAEGQYTCLGLGASGTVLFEANAALRVIAPPQIQLDPVRQVVQPGDNVLIYCSATGDQPITLRWNKQDGPLPRSVAVRDGELNFRGIAVTDAGRYVCTAENSAGRAEGVAEVIVSAGPTVTALDRDVTAYAGSTVNMRCDTTGFDGGRLVWRRERGPLPATAYYQDNTLRLENVDESASGTYICEVRDRAGQAGRDTVRLVVQPTADSVEEVSIRVIPSRDSAPVGASLDLRCQVDGAEGTRVSWQRVDAPLPRGALARGEMLRLTSLTADDGGLYRCTAMTRSGTEYTEDYVLAIQVPPTTDELVPERSAPETVRARLTAPVELRCRSPLQGPLSYTWTKSDGPMPAGLVTSQETLTIDVARVEHAGMYQCTSRNAQTSTDTTTVLLVTEVVPSFGASDRSFVALETIPDAYLSFDVELSFRPASPDGLLLYNGQQPGGTGDFVSFGLRQGYPEFRFNLGGAPAVLRSRRAVVMDVWHTVRLQRDKNRGKMTVDGDAEVTGEADGEFVGLDLKEPLYIGGVPDFSQIHTENGFSNGFIGCVARLSVSGVLYSLQSDAVDRRDVRQCEVCRTDSSCDNSGLCQEALNERGHRCICAAGFTGATCSEAGQVCYPGACGQGRCVNAPGGFSCYCPFGKTGARCERDIVVTEPNFGGDGYIAYNTPRAIRQLQFDLLVKPEKVEDGLLLYAAQNDQGQGDFVALAIKDKHIEFRYDTGTGAAVLRSPEEVKQGEWIKIAGMRQMRDGTLRVNDGEEVQGKSPGSTRGLNLQTPLYLGGVDRQLMRVSDGVGVQRGLIGCVGSLRVDGREVELLDGRQDAANVDQCAASRPCERRPCLNGAECRDLGYQPDQFQCSCVGGFSGKRCEVSADDCERNNPCQNGGECVQRAGMTACNCPLGFGGTYCEQAVEPSSQLWFDMHSYAELPLTLLPHQSNSEPETVNITFSTLEEDGLLFFHGQTSRERGAGQDYIAIAVRAGRPELSFELGSGPLRLTLPQRVNDGRQHTLVARRTGRQGELELDGQRSESGETPGYLTMMNTNGNIYIGGLPDFELMTESRFSRGLVGCVHRLQIQEKEVDLSADITAGVNLSPCTADEGASLSLPEVAAGGTGSGSASASDYTPADYTPQYYDYNNGGEAQSANASERTPLYNYDQDGYDEDYNYRDYLQGVWDDVLQ